MYMGKPATRMPSCRRWQRIAQRWGTPHCVISAWRSQLDGGKRDKALQAMDKQYALGEKKNDVAAMAADLQPKGNIMPRCESTTWLRAVRSFMR